MDFSQYQAPFTEWDELVKRTAIPTTDSILGQAIEQLRDQANAGRLKASNDELRSSGT